MGGIAFSEGKLHLSSGDLSTSLHLLGTEFPDYMSILPKGTCLRYALNRQDTLRSMNRLVLLAQQEIQKVTLVFNVEKSALFLTTETSLGRGYEIVPCKPTMDTEVITNLKHLLDAFGYMSTDSVDIELYGAPCDTTIVLRSGEYFHAISVIAS